MTPKSAKWASCRSTPSPALPTNDPRPPQAVTFPYEDTTLPGWWIPADVGTAHPTGGDPDGPRPTLLYNGGFDSTEEELYFAGGVAAARRGYHVLAFCGPWTRQRPS